jgi:uncharacterized protein YndB with AHSA1/START domain
MEKQKITIEATVLAPATKAWSFYTEPGHIVKWNSASDDWHTTRAENDLRKGGRFLSRMEAKDGSFGFDFGGVYDEVKINELLAYTMSDRRKAKIVFTSTGNQTKMVIEFDAEAENSIEMQRGGWQAILDNFKKYVEF